MSDHDGWMLLGGGWMWIFWVLLIVVLVVVIKLFSEVGSRSSQNMVDESPLLILKKRYARGEIGEEEFERQRKELEN